MEIQREDVRAIVGTLVLTHTAERQRKVISTENAKLTKQPARVRPRSIDRRAGVATRSF